MRRVIFAWRLVLSVVLSFQMSFFSEVQAESLEETEADRIHEVDQFFSKEQTIEAAFQKFEKNFDPRWKSFLVEKVKGNENKKFRFEPVGSRVYRMWVGKQFVTADFRGAKDSIFKINGKNVDFSLARNPEDVWNDLHHALPQRTSATTKWSIVMTKAMAAAPAVALGYYLFPIGLVVFGSVIAQWDTLSNTCPQLTQLKAVFCDSKSTPQKRGEAWDQYFQLFEKYGDLERQILKCEDKVATRICAFKRLNEDRQMILKHQANKRFLEFEDFLYNTPRVFPEQQLTPAQR